MNNLASLRKQSFDWRKELHFFKVEVIFLNNISGRSFCEEVDRLLGEIQTADELLNRHERALEEEIDSYEDMEFQARLWEHLQLRKRMTSLDFKYKSLKTLCKKLTYNNLGLY